MVITEYVRIFARRHGSKREAFSDSALNHKAEFKDEFGVGRIWTFRVRVSDLPRKGVQRRLGLPTNLDFWVLP
jgi:hypothetical protein